MSAISTPATDLRQVVLPRQRGFAAAGMPLGFQQFAILSALHIPLGVLARSSQQLATAAVLLVFVVGAQMVARRPENIAYVAGYLAGAELLWRIAEARVLWELGKYGTIALCLLALTRIRPMPRAAVLGLLVAALFVPSSLLTLDEFGFGSLGRGAVSFNVSGPLSMGVLTGTFLALRGRPIVPYRVLLYTIMPAVGVLGRALNNTVRAEHIEFITESNFVTSGGYGPNQVSTLLGVGALFLAILASAPMSTGRRWLLSLAAAAFLTQGILTFSRGGVLAAVISIAVFLLHLALRPNQARGFLVGITALVLALSLAVLPSLNDWTGGMMSARYSSLESAGRDQLAQQEWELFKRNPILGVGPGMAKFKRADPGMRGYAPHSEFSRAMAEHGLLGGLALAILLGLAISRYLRSRSLWQRAWIATAACWWSLTIASTAMRLVLPSLVFALCCLDVDSDSGRTRGSPRR